MRQRWPRDDWRFTERRSREMKRETGGLQSSLSSLLFLLSPHMKNIKIKGKYPNKVFLWYRCSVVKKSGRRLWGVKRIWIFNRAVCWSTGFVISNLVTGHRIPRWALFFVCLLWWDRTGTHLVTRRGGPAGFTRSRHGVFQIDISSIFFPPLLLSSFTVRHPG